MELSVKLLTVFGLGTLELWAAIPAGFAMQLPPLVIGIAAALGSLLSLVLVGTLGERIRSFILRSHGGKSQHGFIYRIWNRYGTIGLGLLAPLLVGVPIGAALGITLGASVKKLFLWMGVGIVLWSTILTLAGVLGISGINEIKH